MVSVNISFGWALLQSIHFPIKLCEFFSFITLSAASTYLNKTNPNPPIRFIYLLAFQCFYHTWRCIRRFRRIVQNIFAYHLEVKWLIPSFRWVGRPPTKIFLGLYELELSSLWEKESNLSKVFRLVGICCCCCGEIFSFGTAILHSTIFPSRQWGWLLSISSAFCGSFMVTKPNPRDFWLFLSTIKIQSTTSPNLSKYFFKEPRLLFMITLSGF